MNDSITTTFSLDEFDALIYSSREAQIRFKKLKSEISSGSYEGGYSLEECDKKIQHYKKMEKNLTDRRWESTGQEWY